MHLATRTKRLHNDQPIFYIISTMRSRRASQCVVSSGVVPDVSCYVGSKVSAEDKLCWTVYARWLEYQGHVHCVVSRFAVGGSKTAAAKLIRCLVALGVELGGEVGSALSSTLPAVKPRNDATAIVLRVSHRK